MQDRVCRGFVAFALLALALPVAGQARVGDPIPAPIYYPGEDGVSAPKLIHSVPAVYSDEARRARYQGFCMVKLIVDAHGIPRNLHVLRPIGMGLEKNAIEAVKLERFEPGTYFGRPVAVSFSINVKFNDSE